jgi:YVTN family beta-propeller protein
MRRGNIGREFPPSTLINAALILLTGVLFFRPVAANAQQQKNVVAAVVSIGGADSVVVSPDNSTVYVASFNNDTVSVINAATNSVTATIPTARSPVSLALTPDGSTLYVANFGIPHGTVSVIDTGTNTEIKKLKIGDQNFSVAVSPDGDYLYATYYYGIKVIETKTQHIAQTISLGTVAPLQVLFNPNGHDAYALVFDGYARNKNEEELAVSYKSIRKR